MIRDGLEMDYYDPDFSIKKMMENNPYDKVRMLDNGLIVPKTGLKIDDNIEIVFDSISDEELEKEIVKNFEKQLKNKVLELSYYSLKNYAFYLNYSLIFPIKAKYIDKTDLFGIIEYEITINKISDVTNSSKEIKQGLFADCEYSGEAIRIPVSNLTELENDLITQYRDWYFSKVPC